MKLPNTLFGEWDDIPGLARGLGQGSAGWDWQREDTQKPSFLSVDAAQGGSWHNMFVFVAESLALARHRLPLLAAAGKAHVVHVLLPEASAGSDGPKTLAQLTRGMAAAQGPVLQGYRAVSISDGKWVDIHHAVAVVLAQHLDAPPRPVGLRLGFIAPDALDYAAGDAEAAVLRPDQLEPGGDDIFPSDVLVTDSPPVIRSVRQPAAILNPSTGLQDDSGWSFALPPVDTTVLSPRGFEPYPLGSVVRLERRGQGIAFMDGKETVAVHTAGRPLDEVALAGLRSYGYVDLTSAGTLEERDTAVLASRLAVAGVPMLGSVPSLLGPELTRAVSAFDVTDSPLQREAKSIAMRRAALEYFDPATRWGHWAGRFALPQMNQESVSIVLASRRPDKIRHALQQINRQTWGSLEIVLVMHGVDLDRQETEELRESAVHSLTLLSAPSTAVLGEVLNMGVKAASGEYITKMDDDDWYAPNHIRDLVLARRHSRAVLIGSQVEFVYLEDLDITTRRPPEGECYSTHVAGGTMFISSADLQQLGGWRKVHRAVDRCLLQAVDAAGGSIYRTHGLNYVMHRYAETPGHGGHTWAAETETFVHSSREQWTGLVLPPTFDEIGCSYVSPGRSAHMKSMFS